MNLICERGDLQSLCWKLSPVFILTTGRQLSSKVVSLLFISLILIFLRLANKQTLRDLH